MKKHWNEIQPIDQYSVATNGMLQEYDRKIITFLYQPLIGAASYSLFMSLWGEVEENRLWSIGSAHYHLMNVLSMNLQDIYEARLKLEGIGLLKVYEKKSEGERTFIYELQRPLTSQEFFHDGMLNVYLYQKIGRTHYMRLKNFFSDHAVDTEQYSEITRSFQDVFTSEQNINFLQHDANTDSEPEGGKRFIQDHSGQGLPLDDVDFDFSLLLAGLSEAMVPRKAFTVKVKETVVKLSYLYGIDPLQMKNLLLSSIDSEDEIDLEMLRKAARDWYQIQTGDQLPDLTARTTSAKVNRKADKPLSKEDELLDYLETTSPKDVLADISNGSNPSKSDLQAVEEVLMSQKLPIGVMNVLIQYVLLKTDMKLTKGYMEKIASHWARKKVSTAGEAMELAKNEHKQYLEWAQGKKENPTSSRRRKPVRTEKLPEWFREGKESETKEDPTPPESDDYDFEAEKKKLEEELKNFRK
ncbi:replication initiation and membrane attachment family protein [Rossellomorea aquimaris]|uniref:replication initiation and membrane attachment family protein n=1 Tax=Rossellomorea aquimaris TaxID=189382 RepID=UPI001CD476CA|nr:replication initiation and membrane attachment family protein [Rossellomorea aquimaris]MCA1056404.1 replication initiation and membrane attachment family protein [Rossellomorea aquimaris]